MPIRDWRFLKNAFTNFESRFLVRIKKAEYPYSNICLPNNIDLFLHVGNQKKLFWLIRMFSIVLYDYAIIGHCTISA